MMKVCGECNTEYAQYQPQGNWCPRCLGDEYRQRCKEIQILKDEKAAMIREMAKLVCEIHRVMLYADEASKFRNDIAKECDRLSKEIELLKTK